MYYIAQARYCSYPILTSEYLATFRFDNHPSEPTLSFRLLMHDLELSLLDFGRLFRILNNVNVHSVSCREPERLSASLMRKPVLALPSGHVSASTIRNPSIFYFA